MLNIEYSLLCVFMSVYVCVFVFAHMCFFFLPCSIFSEVFCQVILNSYVKFPDKCIWTIDSFFCKYILSPY